MEWKIMILVQLGILVFIVWVLDFMEKRAALRGTRGVDSLPRWVHKGLRLTFLVILVGPICMVLPWLWILVALYAPSFTDLSELSGGRVSHWARNWSLWRWIAQKYYPLSLVKTTDFDPDRSYVFAIQPHGVIPFAGMININSYSANKFNELFPYINLRTLAASVCFYVPGYRDLLLAGGVVDASRYNAIKLLESGHSILLAPGGATEALFSKPDADVVYLRKRHGFIRLAQRYGCPIVPIFTFNENNTYDQVAPDIEWVQRLRRKFQAIFGMSLPLITNILPKRIPCVTVVGEPFEVKKNENPSHEETQAVLDEYINTLYAFYAEHGPKYNLNPQKKLEVV